MFMHMLAAIQAAADPETLIAVAKNTNAVLGVGIGIGLSLVGAGLGLGRIGGQTSEAIARQPEAAEAIRGTALLIVFLMEGATIIAVIMALVAKLI